MIAIVGANTFLIFTGFDVVAAIFCWFFVKETRGKNLEVAAGTEWEAAEHSSSDDGEKGSVLNARKRVQLVSVDEIFPANPKHWSS